MGLSKPAVLLGHGVVQSCGSSNRVFSAAHRGLSSHGAVIHGLYSPSPPHPPLVLSVSGNHLPFNWEPGSAQGLCRLKGSLSAAAVASVLALCGNGEFCKSGVWTSSA